MIEDKILAWRFKRGSSEALARIYEKYEAYLLTLAAVLSNDINTAQDIVHDFFVSFAQSPDKLRIDKSLKGYLATCVVNRTRDRMRAKHRQPTVGSDQIDSIGSNAPAPDVSAMFAEELLSLNLSLARLPYEQREVLLLHFYSGMKFKAIANLQNISINTVQSRYRYGLDKLRSLLDGELKK